MTFEEQAANAAAEWKALSKKPCIYIGTATCGRASGALKLIEPIKEELKKSGLAANIIEVGCIGLCYIEPLVDIAGADGIRISYRNVTPEIIPQLINEHLVNNKPVASLALGIVGDGKINGIPNLFDLPVLKPQERIALRNCGYIDPENINHYIVLGGYRGLARALSMSPDEVIEEVKSSGLRGRGGAGFPTATKWQLCRQAPGDEKYLICNADEGDPGAFMDRALLESDPHSVLEGMLIGAYAIGAGTGYIYIRSEYPLAIARLKVAMKAMEDYGLLGENILGSQLSFHIKLKVGAGAFVCGEETAMLFSIEGRRSVPRSRPPFPATSGLWGKPTNINNVETWANVAAIFEKSGEWYAGYGTEKSKGTKIFALAGKINNTGLIEVPMGITLKEIIYNVGGGIPDGKEFKAVQTGGPSGGCLPKTLLDLPVDYEQLAAAGSIMGSGGMIVADADTCMVDIARYFLTFTQNESCGKCVLCREGTMQMLEILTDITQGKGKPDDIERLLELAEAVKVGSLCALGGTAPNPVFTTIKYFRPEYEAHINEKECPARVCKPLISFYILPDKCSGCMACVKVCPVSAIQGERKMVHVINQEECIKCGMCLDACPPKFKAITKVAGSIKSQKSEVRS
jgi:NADH-quinone oxidoreductase subunit F